MNRSAPPRSRRGSRRCQGRDPRGRCATDDGTPGLRKNGPAPYARYLINPGQPERGATNRRHAVVIVGLLLEELGRLAFGEAV